MKSSPRVESDATIATTIRRTWADQVRQNAARGRAPRYPRLRPQGWLLDAGVPEIIAPHVTHVPTDSGDLIRYAGLGAAAAAHLLDCLPAAELEDRQNLAPTLGSMLRAAVAHPGRVEVHGYVVGPAREDERLTAEGVVVYGLPEFTLTGHREGRCQCAELFDAVCTDLGIDDAEAPPDEITPWSSRSRPGERGWRLWWD